MLSFGHDPALDSGAHSSFQSPIQDQMSQHSSSDGKRAHKAPPLAEELLAVDDCHGWESHFVVRGSRLHPAAWLA